MRAEEVVGRKDSLVSPLLKGKATGLPGLVGSGTDFEFLPCVLGWIELCVAKQGRLEGALGRESSVVTTCRVTIRESLVHTCQCQNLQ